MCVVSSKANIYVDDATTRRSKAQGQIKAYNAQRLYVR